MNVVHVLYLSLLPITFELGTEIYRTTVLKRNDRHTITAAIRFGLMMTGALTYPEVKWWKTILVMMTLHYLLFNYIFNRYALNYHWSYLGNNPLDRIQKHINPTILLWIKVALFLQSILVISYF